MRRRNNCGISGPLAPRSESGMYRVFTVPPGEKPSVFMKVLVSFFLSSLRFFVKHQPLHILMDCPMPEEICQDPVKSCMPCHGQKSQKMEQIYPNEGMVIAVINPLS